MMRVAWRRADNADVINVDRVNAGSGKIDGIEVLSALSMRRNDV